MEIDETRATRKENVLLAFEKCLQIKSDPSSAHQHLTKIMYVILFS